EKALTGCHLPGPEHRVLGGSTMQLNGTPILEEATADKETAPYPLNYGELTAALYASDVPTGAPLADLSAPVGAVVARLGLAEVATRAKRLQRADLASGTRNDRHAYDGYDLDRLAWARRNAFLKPGTTPPAVAVPLAFYDD